jgi:hypothetical protein
VAADVAAALLATSLAGTIVLADTTEHPADHAAWMATMDAAVFPS